MVWRGVVFLFELGSVELCCSLPISGGNKHRRVAVGRLACCIVPLSSALSFWLAALLFWFFLLPWHALWTTHMGYMQRSVLPTGFSAERRFVLSCSFSFLTLSLFVFLSFLLVFSRHLCVD